MPGGARHAQHDLAQAHVLVVIVIVIVKQGGDPLQVGVVDDVGLAVTRIAGKGRDPRGLGALSGCLPCRGLPCRVT